MADPWRNSEELRRVKIRLEEAIKSRDITTRTIVLTISAARALLEVCNQAIHTEEGHGL